MPVRTATAADLDDVLGLLTRRDLAVLGRVEVQRRNVEHQLAQSRDGVVAVGDHGLAGYGTLDGAHDIALAANDAGAAEDLLADIERRARERGFDHVSCIAVREDTVLWELLERSGYARERDIVRMWRRLDGPLTPPWWPDGIAVRTYVDADGERLHALLDAIYLDWDPDYTAIDHDDWLAFMTAHEDFDPSLWFICDRDGGLVACSLHWRATDGDGWVKDIVVCETERRCGLGRALLHHAFRVYRGRGASRVGLKVDTSNPTGAVQLYESVGFVVDRTYRIWARRL